jgi:ABC-type Fe3+/spermidine/putrescine transport system ATPase subunit
MSLLKVAGISLQEAGQQVLKDISFTQPEFQKIAIAGETGSGKSTLLQTIAGLTQPSAGEVLFRGTRVKGLQEQLVPGHPGIAYQSQQFELPPFLRVEQVLKYANKLTPAAAETLYEVCRIKHLLSRGTHQLSGGERQRIALARTLLSAPQLLLLDEPFSNLDMGHKQILKTVIREIGEKLNITVTLISHDPLDTLSWADQIIVMQGGQVTQTGTPEVIYRQPVTVYVAALFGSYNLIPAAQTQIFTGLPGFNLRRGNLLIRPENFKIIAGTAGTLVGEVKQVTFLGAYSETEVQVGDTQIKVKTGTHDWQPGQPVSISVSPEDVVYL